MIHTLVFMLTIVLALAPGVPAWAYPPISQGPQAAAPRQPAISAVPPQPSQVLYDMPPEPQGRVIVIHGESRTYLENTLGRNRQLRDQFIADVKATLPNFGKLYDQIVASKPTVFGQGESSYKWYATWVIVTKLNLLAHSKGAAYFPPEFRAKYEDIYLCLSDRFRGKPLERMGKQDPVWAKLAGNPDLQDQIVDFLRTNTYILDGRQKPTMDNLLVQSYGKKDVALAMFFLDWSRNMPSIVEMICLRILKYPETNRTKTS